MVTAVLGNHTQGQGVSSAVVFDGSLGKPAGALIGDTIFASQGSQLGSNLFHSFSQFNVAKDTTVIFQVPLNAENILARVTGGSSSQIDGKITADAAVNLYLMNPNGIVFGNGASVDVAGAFTATTADYISFKDMNGGESRFWATTDGATTLVSDPPSKFGFLDSGASGQIAISRSRSSGGFFSKGAFTVVGREILVSNMSISNREPGSDLSFYSLQAGEIGIAGEDLTAGGPGGRGDISFTNSIIELASGRSFQVRAAGKLVLDRTLLSAPEGPQGSSPSNIGLVSGGDLALLGRGIQKFNDGSGESGSVLLDSGGNLTITNRASVTSKSSGIGGGADITIKTRGNLEVSNSGLIQSETRGRGNGGKIDITANGNLEVSGSGLVQSATRGTGNGGGIGITASGNLNLSRFGLIQSGAESDGNGGAIQIQAASLSINGELERQPDGRTTGIESLTEGLGAGGEVSVRADGQILLRDTGGIYASANASGQSGSIEVKSNSLHIIGARNYSAAEESIRPDNYFITGISIKNARNNLTGSLGSIHVDVRDVIKLERGGLIDATSFSLNPAATAGDVSVKAGEIRADRMGSDYFTGIGSGTVTDESSGATESGGGGVVFVEAPLIGLSGGAQIAASSRSGGDAGSVKVLTHQLVADGRGAETDFLFTGESGIVAATRGQSTGGAGDVTVSGMVNSGISSQPSLILSNGAEISARAEGAGGGGSVLIDFTGGRVSLDSGAGISARSGQLGGDAGSVTITAADIQVGSQASISSTNGATPAIGGDAGSVTLNPGNLRVDGGRLEVSATGGNAGSVSIFGGDLLDFINAEVVAEAFLDGGNISMQGAGSLLLDQSRISANAERGNGGNILLNAGVILNNGSQITASSRFGFDGVVRIDPQVTLSGAEEQADPDPLDATDSLQPECTNRLATAAGSFIRAGRGGTPRLPGGYLPSLRLHRAR
jgi:filamentous hemagglutinin family protein